MEPDIWSVKGVYTSKVFLESISEFEISKSLKRRREER
ncbi:MAG: hypothetical protein ACI86P_002701 [Flavobacteriales bacterium]